MNNLKISVTYKKILIFLLCSSVTQLGLLSSTCHLLGLRPKEQWPPRVRDSQSNGSSTEREPNCAIAIQFSLTSHWPKHVPWPSPKSKEGRFPRLPWSHSKSINVEYSYIEAKSWVQFFNLPQPPTQPLLAFPFPASQLSHLKASDNN